MLRSPPAVAKVVVTVKIIDMLGEEILVMREMKQDIFTMISSGNL